MLIILVIFLSLAAFFLLYKQFFLILEAQQQLILFLALLLFFQHIFMSQISYIFVNMICGVYYFLKFLLLNCWSVLNLFNFFEGLFFFCTINSIRSRFVGSILIVLWLIFFFLIPFGVALANWLITIIFAVNHFNLRRWKNQFLSIFRRRITKLTVSVLISLTEVHIFVMIILPVAAVYLF